MAIVAPVDTPELPKVFGRYLLLRRLSRGGMGEIFLAKLGEILGFEKLVIIKKILPNLVEDQEFIKRFIDEAQVAIKLNHGNIAPVFEVGKVDGEYFLAIEYIEGRDLRRLMARCRETRTRLPADLCLLVVRELSNGLAYAHRRTDADGNPLSLVHCDISPPNLMVSFEGEVKIIDFGIAKSAIRIAGSNPNMGFGKFGYMAPEQLIRGGVVDRRTDIYAAGVVLYELLTGERLFQFPEGADYRTIARIVTAGKVIPPSVRDPRLDPELDGLVLRAIASNKDDRYQTGEEFRDAIAGRLAQMNPTLSADTLSHFLRNLFADEILDEKQLVESMKAVDVAPFREELTAAAAFEHTVTFARALDAKPAGRGNTGSVQAIGPTTAPYAQRGQLLIGMLALVAALVAGTFVAVRLARRPLILPTTVSSAPSIPYPPSPPPQPTPVVVASPPLAVASPSPSLAPSPSPVVVAPPPRRAHTRVTSEDPSPSPRARHSADAVQEKFRTLSREYTHFKTQYGAVLEEKWNAIASEITFGKGADKFEHVDTMLDALRRDMAKIRDGG